MKNVVKTNHRTAITAENRERVIIDHIPLVDYIVKSKYRIKDRVCMDELRSAGLLGLVKAANNFEPQGTLFKTYAEHKINGSILDYLRCLDALPINIRQCLKKIEEVDNQSKVKTGKGLTNEELCKALDIKINRLYHIHDCIEFESFKHPTCQENDPFLLLEKNMFNKKIHEAIEQLQDRMKATIKLMYFDGLNGTEISRILGVSPQRVYQIRHESIRSLKRKLGYYIKVTCNQHECSQS